MAYLKALGILRLVGEQKDPNARGWWENDVFWLRSPVLFTLKRNECSRWTGIRTSSDGEIIDN